MKARLNPMKQPFTATRSLIQPRCPGDASSAVTTRLVATMFQVPTQRTETGGLCFSQFLALVHMGITVHENTSLYKWCEWFRVISLDLAWFHYVCIMMYHDVRWFITILSWCFRARWSVWRARLQIDIWALHENQACLTKLYESILGYLRGSLFL